MSLEPKRAHIIEILCDEGPNGSTILKTSFQNPDRFTIKTSV